MKETPKAKLSGLYKVLHYAWQHWQPYRTDGLCITGLIFLDKLFWLYFGYNLKGVIDTITVDGGMVMTRFLTAMLIVFPLVVGANLIGDRRMVSVRVRMANDIRMQMFMHLQRLSSDFYVCSKPGDLLARFAGDLESIERVISERFLNSVIFALALLIYVAALFYLSWYLALFTLLVLLVAVPCIKRFTPRVLAAFYHIRQAESEVLSFVQENVRAQPIVKGFGLQDRVTGMFRKHLERFAGKYVEAFFTNSLVDKAIVLVVMYVVLLVAAFGAWLVHWQATSAGSVVAFLGLLAVLSKDLLIFGHHLEHLFRASGGVRRIEELLQQQPQVVDAPRAIALPRFSREIRFEDVSFSYTGEAPHLNHIDAVIPAGQYVAIVGPSGAGKSTLLRLLLRFYDASAGKVTLDGHDVRTLSQASLRAQMGIVFQDAFLFHASIRHNISLFDPDVTDQQIEAASKAAEIHDFIMSLPEGYHTQVGDAGSRLSGGQRQRIAIARALVRNPVILLLDEVAVSLDAETADAVHRTIKTLAGSRTVVAVTHNLRHAAFADMIIVMNTGRIVETGSHHELMARQALYAQLWNTQQNGRPVFDDLLQKNALPS